VSHRLTVAGGACAGVGGWLMWRYVELGARVDAIRRELAENLRPVADSATAPGDASDRIAKVVAADEALFDQAVRLASVQRVVGAAAVALWIVAAVVLCRWYRERAMVRRTAGGAVDHM
jgi:hypothetical protein